MKYARIFTAASVISIALANAVIPVSIRAQPLSPISSTTVSISVLFNEKEGSPYNPEWLVMKEIAKRKGIKALVSPAPDTKYDQAVASVFAKGQAPDLVLKVWPEQITGLAAAGLLLPISDYEHLMPHYQRYIRDNNLEAEVDKLRDEHGKYYILPGFQRELQVQQWIYRKDIFTKHGISTPATYDELYSALTALKKLYPDSKPLTATWSGAHLFAMMGPGFGIPAGWNGTRLYDRSENTWKFAPATSRWRDMVRFLARCYKTGLLDPDIFTQDTTMYTQKLLENRSFVTVTWISSGFSNWNLELEAKGYKNAEWAPFHPPKSPLGLQALPGVSKFRKGAVMPVRVMREPYFRRLIEFVDWIFYSEEGMALANWGVEGLTYEAKHGRRSYIPSIRSFNYPQAKFEAARDYGLSVMWDLCELPDFEDSKKPPEIVRFLEETLSRKFTEPLAPALTLTMSEQSTLKIFSGELEKAASESMVSFIKGSMDIEKDWPVYIALLEKKGWKEIEEIWNAAWKRQGGAHKKP